MKKRTVRKMLCNAIFCIMVCFAMTACGGADGKNQDTAGEMPHEGQNAVEDGITAENMTAENTITEGEAAEDSRTTEGKAAEDKTGKGASADTLEGDEALSGRYAGMKVSILGDSLSTYEGWIPEGYAIFFPFSGEVTDVDQTWWKMFLDRTGMELCMNGSSAGSTCAGYSLSEDDPQCGCDDYRIEDLIGGGGTYPDIIIVYMGTNDLLKSVPLGENDGTEFVEEGDIDNFSDAYCLMLDKLQSRYPGAQIFCCTLTQIGDWGTTRLFETFENQLGLASEDYNRQIQIIAGAKNCTVIDLQQCGITIDNMERYITDGVHFNPDGMKLVEKTVTDVIVKSSPR